MYKPKNSIVLYESPEGYYAEIHPIDPYGNVGSGRPLRASELNAFSIIAQEEDNILEKECIPYRNILGFKSSPLITTIAWIFPAQKIKLLYSEEVVGLKTDEYYIPNIVFVSDGNNVDLYAIKNKDLFDVSENTQLYHAPFFNINENASVCMGSAVIKQYNSITDMIYSVEQAFFESVFTHTNHDNIVKGSIIDCYNNQKNKFDEKLLLEICKMKDIWK